MQEALKLINSSKIYKKIFKEVYKKYRNYGRITGCFTVKSEYNEDIDVLINFDTNVVHTNKAVIKCSLVEELFNRKLKNNTFIELMERVIGSNLTTNKEEKIRESNRQSAFFEYIIINSKNGSGNEWFNYIRKKKLCGYNTVIRKYKECINEVMIENLQKDLILVNNALSSLPYLNNKKENIAVFAADITKNPHFFDYNNYTGKLLISGIEYIFNKYLGRTIDELNELYYDAGIIKDEISNHTTIFNFNAYDKEDNEIKAVKMFSEWEEPLELSLSNLLKIDYLKANNNKVFVFENPTVFNEMLRKSENKVSLICTSGQLNLSSYMILDKIKDLEFIYYAGDFDPEGLLIADKIKLKYKEKVKFIFYDEETYKSIKSFNEVTDRRLTMLNKIKSPELKIIKQCLNKEKKAAYQEMLICKYIDYINKIIIK